MQKARHGHRMGKIVLVTGGARSGKSSFAERLVKEQVGKALYIATAVPFDDEMKDRIKKHKESRPDNWDTHEGYKNIADVIDGTTDKYQVILLDCVTVMVTNLMFDSLGFENQSPAVQDFEMAEKLITKEFVMLIEALKKASANIVMVTNELGSGIVPENPLSRGFRDIAGRINQLLGANSDEVYLTVCGIPLKIK